MARTYKNFTVSISTGATGLSGAIVLEGYTPYALQISTAWTAASITLQGSLNGTTFGNVYSDTGGEYTMICTASRVVLFNNPERFMGLQAMKIRSGVSTAAQAQAAARTLTLLTRQI